MTIGVPRIKEIKTVEICDKILIWKNRTRAINIPNINPNIVALNAMNKVIGSFVDISGIVENIYLISMIDPSILFFPLSHSFLC